MTKDNTAFMAPEDVARAVLDSMTRLTFDNHSYRNAAPTQSVGLSIYYR